MIQGLVRAGVASVAAKLSPSNASRRGKFVREFLARDRVLMRAARCSAPIPVLDRFPPAKLERISKLQLNHAAPPQVAAGQARQPACLWNDYNRSPNILFVRFSLYDGLYSL